MRTAMSKYAILGSLGLFQNQALVKEVEIQKELEMLYIDINSKLNTQTNQLETKYLKR